MKKALIIAYYWPPAGGPGVQRWLKFAKYLPNFNVEPIVYVPENPNYPIIDETLLDEIPNNITILRQPIKEPYKLAGFLSRKESKRISKGIIHQPKSQTFIEKVLLYIRGNFFIPDARKNWVKPSVEYLSKYIQENNIETIITTGPPHSLHLIGMQLKQKLGVKWLADFRDPWTTIGYHNQLKLSKKSATKHKQLEKEVLLNADEIITTSFTTSKEFQSIVNKHVITITNGYDDQKKSSVELDKKFTCSHIGSLLSQRNPEVLWKVFQELINENEDFKNNFQLNLIGVVSEDVLNSIYKHQLKEYVNLIGYVSHQDAVNYQKQSQVLLLIEIDSEDTKCIIPGKLFEYMVSERPIIAIGPKGADVETIIKQTNTGNYFTYNDYESLKNLFLNHLKAFKDGNLHTQPIGLQKYHRKQLTKQLSELI